MLLRQARSAHFISHENKDKRCKWYDLNSSYLGYNGGEWDRKINNMDNPNFWKYGVANLVFLELAKGKKKILDIGCGTGGLTLFLTERTKPDLIMGIDSVRSMIKVAKQHAQKKEAQRTHFVVCDGRCLPFRPSSFDALVSRGDAFAFLVPQGKALIELRRTLDNGAVVIIEMDNVTWKQGQTVFCGFERLANGAIAYCLEYFDAKRNRKKTFYILDEHAQIAVKVSKNQEFIRTGKLQQRFSLKRIRKEIVEVRHSVVTHWPTVEEIQTLFANNQFENIQVFGDGLLMSLLLEGDNKVIETIKKQPELFFKIEKEIMRFIDAKKAPTIILKAINSARTTSSRSNATIAHVNAQARCLNS